MPTQEEPMVTGGTDHFAPLAKQTFVVLTSFRRDGTPAGTPVNITVDGDRAYIQTGRNTAKVKRILRDSRVTVAPSTARGRATGPAIEATARLLDGDEARHAVTIINSKHPVIHGVLVRLGHRLTKTQPALLELSAPAAPIESGRA
jgi:PPOX class probable F420-dependent enzyme